MEPDLRQAVVQAQGLFDPGLQIGIAIQGDAAEQYRVIFQGGVQEHAPQALGHNCRRVGVAGAPGDEQTKFPVRGGHQLLHGAEKFGEPGRYGLDILDGGVGGFVQHQHQAGQGWRRQARSLGSAPIRLAGEIQHPGRDCKLLPEDVGDCGGQG